MVSELKEISEQEIYNAFGIPQELFKASTPTKDSAETQLKQFIELNKTFVENLVCKDA